MTIVVFKKEFCVEEAWGYKIVFNILTKLTIKYIILETIGIILFIDKVAYFSISRPLNLTTDLQWVQYYNITIILYVHNIEIQDVFLCTFKLAH